MANSLCLQAKSAAGAAAFTHISLLIFFFNHTATTAIYTLSLHDALPIPGKRDPDWAYSWVPVVGPIVGGSLGALTYQALFAPGVGNLEVLGALRGVLG